MVPSRHHELWAWAAFKVRTLRVGRRKERNASRPPCPELLKALDSGIYLKPPKGATADISASWKVLRRSKLVHDTNPTADAGKVGTWLSASLKAAMADTTNSVSAVSPYFGGALILGRGLRLGAHQTHHLNQGRTSWRLGASYPFSVGLQVFRC